MKLNIFKNDDQPKKKSKKIEPSLDLNKDQEGKKEDGQKGVNYVAGAYQIIKNFYISEKATNLINNNQYVFVAGKKANKVEIRKNIEKIFNVKVESVKIINMPSKTRNVGRHSGIKSGFKKAIVTLRDGYAIEQAKA